MEVGTLGLLIDLIYSWWDGKGKERKGSYATIRVRYIRRVSCHIGKSRVDFSRLLPITYLLRHATNTPSAPKSNS